MDELANIFNYLDEDQTGTLTLTEFRDWQYNDRAKDCFKNLIRKVREGCVDVNGNYVGNGQMPYEFCIMLEYLTNKMTRDSIHQRIKDKTNDESLYCAEPAKDYLALFNYSA